MQDGGAHRFYEKTAVHNEYNAQKRTILAAKSHRKCLTLKTVALAAKDLIAIPGKNIPLRNCQSPENSGKTRGQVSAGCTKIPLAIARQLRTHSEFRIPLKKMRESESVFPRIFPLHFINSFVY